MFFSQEFYTPCLVVFFFFFFLWQRYSATAGLACIIQRFSTFFFNRQHTFLVSSRCLQDSFSNVNIFPPCVEELSLRSPAPSLAVITLYGVAVQYWEEGGGNNPKSLSLKRRRRVGGQSHPPLLHRLKSLLTSNPLLPSAPTPTPQHSRHPNTKEQTQPPPTSYRPPSEDVTGQLEWI